MTSNERPSPNKSQITSHDLAPLLSFSFQQLPTIKFSNHFVLITIRIAGGGCAPPVLGAVDFQQLTNCLRISPPMDTLCFQPLTHCPISKSLLFITLQQYPGVVGTSAEIFKCATLTPSPLNAVLCLRVAVASSRPMPVLTNVRSRSVRPIVKGQTPVYLLSQLQRTARQYAWHAEPGSPAGVPYAGGRAARRGKPLQERPLS